MKKLFLFISSFFLPFCVSSFFFGVSEELFFLVVVVLLSFFIFATSGIIKAVSLFSAISLLFFFIAFCLTCQVVVFDGHSVA